jgi:GDP-4-dehydro-6-deoxy-D-mannose reductase
MRALVTGASGFVGRHLVAHLRAEGDDVVGVDRAAGGIDIADEAAVRSCVADAAPEAVYHLAGWSDVGGSWGSPTATFVANANGTQHVLLAAIAAGVRRVLIVSSADVYGVVREHELPLTETSPLRPTSPYAASKVAADHLGLQAWLGHGLEVLRARAFNHLGPGQTPRFVAPALAERIARAERAGEGASDEIEVGNLSPRRDITDVRDVVRAYRLLVEAGQPGEAYNVCSGTDVSIEELATRLLAMATRPLRLVHDPSLDRPVDIPVLRGDASKLRTATGWTPRIALDTTLRDVLADWRSRVASS